MSERFWIAVASADHVAQGVEWGIMQVCHGKVSPLKRISPGDWVMYYSPTQTFGGKDKVQAFTAIGQVKEGCPYQVEMAPDFHPYRRDVNWVRQGAVPIQQFLAELSFAKGRLNWGYQLRFGLFQVTRDDLAMVFPLMHDVLPRTLNPRS